MAKKASLCKTCKNDEVSNLNEETEKAMETLAVLHEHFQQVKSDLADIDKKFDKAFEEMEDAMEKANECSK